MLRKAIAFAVACIGATSHAQSSAYNWVGDHACVVEDAMGVQAFMGISRETFFEWDNFGRSFVAQIRVCPQPAGDGWALACNLTNAGKGTQVLKINRTTAAFPLIWDERYESTAPFISSDGSVLMTLPDGRFQFSLPGRTTEKNPAWFMASGTCSPLSR